MTYQNSISFSSVPRSVFGPSRPGPDSGSASPRPALRDLRLACHLSQEQAASLLMISRQSYGCYERGEREMPPELLQICSRLYRGAYPAGVDEVRERVEYPYYEPRAGVPDNVKPRSYGQDQPHARSYTGSDAGSCLPLAEAEQDLLTCFRRLDADSREQILSMVRYEASLA